MPDQYDYQQDVAAEGQRAAVLIPSCWPVSDYPAVRTDGLPFGRADVVAFGCICPPGANFHCQNPSCPRKPLPSEVRAL